MILKTFLIADFQPGDSYKKNSCRKNGVISDFMMLDWGYFIIHPTLPSPYNFGLKISDFDQWCSR